ncbi:helix-turn-helix domain-containing protein [Burkholderia sp. Ed8]|uniref:helix-turn-helix domain-containing protein n=1 Tax=Burkholderia sp. Ed8 TaxID=3112957 RepID=UPI00345DB18D
MRRVQHDDLSINFDEWLRSRIGATVSNGGHDSDEERELRIALRAVELYANRHPRPPQVNQKQAAEMLGVSARTVHNMIRFGTLRLNRCGLVSIEEVDKLLASES